MSELTKDQKEDYRRFYVKDPKDFSEAKSRATIEQTIVDYEKMRERKMKDRVSEYEERADAVVSYLKHLSHSEKPMDKYFSRRELARLRGDEIRAKLMARMTIMTTEGEIIKKGS